MVMLHFCGHFRYNLKFRRETAAQKARRKELHSKPVEMLPKNELETNTDVFYPAGLSYPSRPPWNASMSKKTLDMSENRHFRLFCEKIDKEFSPSNLSMYELNLETWRQLWRVTEMSDILLIIADARFPVSVSFAVIISFFFFFFFLIGFFLWLLWSDY